MKPLASISACFFFALFGAVLLPSAGAVEEAPRVQQVRVFVALADNDSQGIARIGATIGDGDDASANLYWGCSDGLGRFFLKSDQWKQIEIHKDDGAERVLRRLHLRHVSGEIELVAEAYRGSELKACLRNFEAAAASGRYDVVAFIGHNGLMDFDLALPEKEEASGSGTRGRKPTEAIVLCCLSERDFSDRLDAMGCRPILLTRQLMYPGAFLLHDVLEVWKVGGSRSEIRAAAGRAYAKNQGLSVGAATGVFADLK